MWSGPGLAGIDSTVVNIALPNIGRHLHASFGTLQWTVTAYTLTLASLILLGGALGDRYGRRRIFVLGVLWFAVSSLLCAVAPGAGWLVAARAVQGMGAALATPASLAIIQTSFRDADQSRAIGAWSGLSGTASAIAPIPSWLAAGRRQLAVGISDQPTTGSAGGCDRGATRSGHPRRGRPWKS